MQKRRAGQATLSSVGWNATAGFGVGWIAHRVPFHRSASVPTTLPELSVEAPTPVQAEGEAQETVLKPPPPVAGVGDGTMRHFTPFHRSASVPWSDPPTARHSDGPVQATPCRAANWVPGGFGVGWMRHARPFQRSASVVASPELSKESPVVVQADGEVQDIDPPTNTPCAPAGAGMGSVFQVLPFHRSASGDGLGVLGPEAPVAMQNERIRQDTAPRMLPWDPPGLGVGWTRQVVPFHRSARATKVPALLVVWPTAVHDAGDVHETPISCPGGRAGVGRMRQRVPFHRSARYPPMSLGLEVPPTAMQDLGDVQDTPNRPLAAAPARLGVDWMAHLLPFQCSARVTGVLRLLIELPTEVQAAADMHDTAFRMVNWKANCGMGGLGVDWMCQLVPSQRSARGKTRSSPELLPWPPTAVHAETDVHDTAFRKLNCAPDGLGVAWMRHRAPFHRSASVPAFELPTAKQEDAEVQATPLSPAPPCDGLGVSWIFQVLPFHRSATVPAFENPTAKHDDAEVQATPFRTPPPGAGFGVAWMRHTVPFHRSAKVLALGVKALETPTAVHADAEVQATPFRTPPPGAGFGVAWMRHTVPFHRSTKVLALGVKALETPTAVHADAEVQATPFRTPPPGAGFGVAWMRHTVPFHRSAKGVGAPWLL